MKLQPYPKPGKDWRFCPFDTERMGELHAGCTRDDAMAWLFDLEMSSVDILVEEEE